MKKDKNNYKGWLNSDSFIKRSLGVTLHNFVGSLVIWLTIFIPIFIIMAGLGMYKFNYLANQHGQTIKVNPIDHSYNQESHYDSYNENVNVNSIDHSSHNHPHWDDYHENFELHPSCDLDKDGLADCMNDHTCDHTVDYTMPC